MVVDAPKRHLRYAPENLEITEELVEPDHASDELIRREEANQQRAGKQADTQQVSPRSTRMDIG